MRIAIFGLGYVGSVSAACLAGQGHSIVGVDTNADKVGMIADGISPVQEPQVPELLQAAKADGRVSATTFAAEAIAITDMSMLCVGTPSQPSGNIDLAYIESVAAQIGTALADLDHPHTVVIRSTVMPGTAERVGQILEETSGRRLGEGLAVAVNPEFLREGQGVADFFAPPLVLIGADDSATAAQIAELYAGIEAEVLVEPTRLAEMVKYANNSWHAVKVTFANEIGAVAGSLGIDGSRVMEILCADKKLNISTAYLRPGFAFGGSCLPKDVRALGFAAKSQDVSVPLINSLLNSNAIQVQRVVDQLVSWSPSSIGFFGLSFKKGTDDMRESPLVEVVERMVGKGFGVVIHDEDVFGQELIGKNRDFIEREIPHLSNMLREDAADVAGADVLVISKVTDAAMVALRSRRPGTKVVDLVRIPDADRLAIDADDYVGVAW